MLFPEDKAIIRERLEALGFHTYRDYQRSALWQDFRATIPKKKCYCCGHKKKSPLQLHHLLYESLGEENPVDVCWLCDVCHKQVHLLYMSYSGKKPWDNSLLGFATEYLRQTYIMERAEKYEEREKSKPPKPVFERHGVKKQLEWISTGGLVPTVVVPRSRFMRG
jgi:hypothetical protein